MQGEVSHKRRQMAAGSSMGIGCDGVGASYTGERRRWKPELSATSIVGVGGDGGGALSKRSQFQKNRKAEVRDGGCAVDDASYGDKKIRVVLHPFNIYYIRSFLLIDS
jgi:hypothetical protein